MKSYPSVSHDIVRAEPIIAFDKLDGSNIRAEWSRKAGFYKWGTRNRLLDPNGNEILSRSVDLILDKYSEDLEQIARDEHWQRAVFFFEFFGPQSFAGLHEEGDKFDVVLFDVAQHKQGLMNAREFLKTFGHLDVPAVLYEGKANQLFEQSVRESTLEGMTFEGVVCKGTNRHSHCAFKIKSEAWLDALRNHCDGDDALFRKLA